MTPRVRPLIVALALVLVAPVVRGVPPVAAVDYLDPTFGTGGKVRHAALSPAGDVALQSDGKIVVIGGSGAGFSVTRLTTAGALDTTFDGDGTASIGDGTATGLAIQSDGKIVIVGSSSIEGMPGYCCRLGVARLNTNGSPDTTFGGGDGFVVHDPGVVIYGGGVAIQTDEKIVVGGTQESPPARGIYVGRLSATGTVDGTFGTSGFTMSNLTGTPSAGALALQSDGKILLGGSSGTNSDFLVARYTTAGAFDATFDGDGMASVGFTFFGSPDADYLSELAIQADGKIVALGTAGFRFGLARLTTAGALDTTFGGDGRVETQFYGSGYGASASGLAIQSDGKIVAVGTLHHDYDSSFAITRYAADGWADSKTTLDFGDPEDVGVVCPPARPDCSEDGASDVAIQSNGMVVVVGGAGECGSPCEMALARYSDLPPVKSLGVAPTEVGFGTEIVGTAPGAATVTLTNTGSDVVALASFELESSDAGLGLSISGSDCPPTLASRASCDVSLAFAPMFEGSLTGQLSISSDGEVTPLIVAISGTAAKAPSGVTWSTKKAAGPAWTWNGGGAMARTVQSGTQRLHLAYATDRINSTWAKNTGPYVGVYYIRSTTGATWTAPKRLNPTSQHAARLGLAAAGSRVYTTWVSQTKWINYSATAPRVLYVRVNTSHGASTAWRSTIRLTSTTGRVDYPTIAATGSDVHIAYTNSGTGAIRVASSRDGGVTWSQVSIGSTSISTSDGRLGLPSVAVSGSTVVVAWISDIAGTIKLRVSTNRGVSWGTTETVGSQSTGAVSAAVRGTRIAVAWTTPREVVVRQRLAGAWGAAKVISRLDPYQPYSPYGPQVLLQGTSTIGLAWSEEKAGDWEIDLKWAESVNGGALWFRSQTLASSSSGPRANDWSSVVWPTAGTRYVAWNAWDPFTPSYRLYLRTGTGVPVTPTLATEDWAPGDDVALPWTDPDLAVGLDGRVGPSD